MRTDNGYTVRRLLGRACSSRPFDSISTVCSPSFPRPRLRKAFDLGVARCAEHRYAVHNLPRALLPREDKARIKCERFANHRLVTAGPAGAGFDSSQVT